jgi:L-gulonolactone oxidase
VDGDDVWMSPSYGRKTCYIGVIMYRWAYFIWFLDCFGICAYSTTPLLHRPYGKPVPYKKYWRAYEDVMRSLGGRPHWAKVRPAAFVYKPALSMKF